MSDLPQYAIQQIVDDARMAAQDAWQQTVSRMSEVAEYQVAPSAVFRPVLSIDGDQWCALYGEDFQNGVAGFGDSPAQAMQAFDAAWFAKLGPRIEPPKGRP